MAVVDPNKIPEGVYWTGGKEPLFRDADGKSMGGQFFEQWKDRREEFPQSKAELGGGDVVEEKPSTGVLPRRRNQIAQVAEEMLSEVVVTDGTYGGLSRAEFLEMARARKALFDVYVEVGFTRDEALELCVK